MTDRRTYDDEMRTRVVQMVEERVRTHGDSRRGARLYVAELLGISPATVRNWLAKNAVGADRNPSTGPAISEELVTLRRENAELRRKNEILRAAAALFAAAELDRRFG